MKLMIVDDNESFIKGLSFLLSDKKKYQIVAVAKNGIEAIKKLDKIIPDLVLMDIEMPELNGIEATKKILWKFSSIKFIAITMYQDKAYLEELIGAGFKGCVFKNKVSKDLEKAINEVMKGSMYFPDNINLEQII